VKRRIIPLILALSIVMALAGCSGTQKDSEIILYDGDFSEMQLVHTMIKQLVEHHTDATVTIKDRMSAVNMFKELTGNKSCDLMFSYDGTLLTTFLKLDPDDVPQGQTLFDFANEKAREQYGVYLVGKVGLNNTYAIGVTQDVVDTYGVTTISDLIPIASELKIGAEPEFCTLEGSMKYDPFVAYYGLHFKQLIQVDVMLKYTAAEEGNFEVMVVYATDGMNKRTNLTVLEDDRHFFPEYNGAILVTEGLFEKFKDAAPNLEEVLNMLNGNISTEDMIDLTYQVDVEGKDIAEVSRAFLESKGLLPAG